MKYNNMFYMLPLLTLLLLEDRVVTGINMEAGNEYGLSFFTPNELKVGMVMPLLTQIFVMDPSKPTRFFPRDDANLIPFSSSQLPYILNFFGYAQGSSDAKTVEDTLITCESSPARGESKFCATSLESMLDSVHQILGPGVDFKALSTKPLETPADNKNYVENYTIVEEPEQVPTPNAVLCHLVSYPYAVYHCHHMHNTEKMVKVFKVSLRSENEGAIVEAISVCHFDTSEWGSDHMAYRVFEIEFGSTVCHFFPAYDLVWVPLISKPLGSI